jgi:translation initiation factor 1
MASSRPAILIFLPEGDPHGAAIEQALLSHAGPFGLPWRLQRVHPGQVSAEDLQTAAAIVTLTSVAAPAGAEVWSETLTFETQAAGLIQRLCSSEVTDSPGHQPRPEKPRKRACVGRETAGRRGKGVVTIFDTGLDDPAMKELAATLKTRCGCGGTIKEGRIEIQGDHRERVIAELERLGFQVRRVGG